MIELGRFQNFIAAEFTEHGVYLEKPGIETAPEGSGDEREAAFTSRKTEGPSVPEVRRVLLPKREVPEDMRTGEPVRAFIYRDSSDRLIATLEKPLIELHEVKLLSVKDVTKIGAFLDWGLQKDLLLPYAEMIGKVRAGDSVLAALYVDRSGRLAATMKIYPYLKTRSPYMPGDSVSGRVYQIEESFGVFVAVDDLYSALIPKREAAGSFHLGEMLQLRVTAVKEDGKLDVTTRDKAYLQMDEDAENILAVIAEDYGGELPFDDKADPEKIREIFGLSKAAFKRAVGRLYKEHRISLGEGKISIV